MTKNLFRNIWINFVKKRKVAYVLSALLVAVSISSIAVNGFKYGIDFTGGRSFVIRFDKDIDTEKVKESLSNVFKNKRDNLKKLNQQIEQKLYTGLKNELPSQLSLEEFKTTDKNPIGIVSSTKVGPTVADDIKTGGALSVIASLVGIFAYILIRFRKWQFSLGAIIGLAFDSIIILGSFSLFYNVMPFNMEINQDFIAAILTILGYSINDTVIIFDRIREYLKEGKSRTLTELFNDAISSTLGRTINTSFTVLLVILAIFIFGGENLRGFMFALLLGIVSGTFSTIFIASLLAYDFLKGKEKNEIKE